MEAGEAGMQDLVDQMLAMIDQRSQVEGRGSQRFNIKVADTRIDFDLTAPNAAIAFEHLAAVIEAVIAAERAGRMVEAVASGPQPLPLWLVSGSDVLAQWLCWAGVGNALRKVIVLSNATGMAPVVGYLDRRARRELGQGGARIRVAGGTAIAERIELSDRPRCTAILGQSARIRIEAHKLPETLISALQQDARGNALRPLAEVVSHPFFAAADLRIIGVANEGSAVVFDVETRWAPLEPVPAAAWKVLPSDADPAFPWRATAGERRRLDGLVDEARHRLSATDGQC